MTFPSSGLAQFDYLYQVSPIILTGGIAQQIPGAQLSIASFLQADAFGFVTSPGADDDGGFFGRFVPMAGSTLIDNDIGEYPFANQQTAGNAIITKPLVVGYRLICPASGPSGFGQKQMIMTALQQTLMAHNLLGGLYACATPAFFWENCILRAMRDISGEEATQKQVIWQLEFEQPLVTQQQAQQQYNTLLSKIAAGSPVTPDGGGAIATSGLQAGSPASGQAPSVSPPVQSQSLGFAADNFTVSTQSTPSTSLP